ncbi:MAG: hypothetical protein ACI4HI_07300 [Lachnospiraceae bacterium]
MQLKEYKNVVDQMRLPEDMDARLKHALFEDQKAKKCIKRKQWMKRVCAASVAVLFMVAASQTSFLSDVKGAITHFFKYGFTFTQQDGEQTVVDMKMGYLTLKAYAPKEDLYMDSLEEVSDAIGIKLLHSTEEYVDEESVEYRPVLSEQNALEGILISHNYYAVGDMKNISVQKRESENSINTIDYEAGEKYQTPIGVQIAVRTDDNLTSQYQDHELGFVSENVNVNLDDKSADAELYEIPDLGVKAVLFTVETDGPMTWGIEDGTIDVTNAVLVYQGVEYVYCGGVSHDTMKEFLDTLG